jgi:hypothetical protein
LKFFCKSIWLKGTTKYNDNDDGLCFDDFLFLFLLLLFSAIASFVFLYFPSAGGMFIMLNVLGIIFVVVVVAVWLGFDKNSILVHRGKKHNVFIFIKLSFHHDILTGILNSPTTVYTRHPFDVYEMNLTFQ